MKAVTLWQPWATLIALGLKTVETRSWSPGIEMWGQPLAIHAAKTQDHLDLCHQEPFKEGLLAAGYYPGAKPLPHGAIVAVCTLSRVRKITDEMGLWMESHKPVEFAFGDYTPGRWAWILGGIQPLEEPVAVPGGQKLWTVEDDLVYGRSLF